MGFNTEFMEAFFQLIDTRKLEGMAYPQIASSLVIQLLRLVYAPTIMKDKPQLRKEREIQKIQLYLQKNWSEKVNFRERARKVNFTFRGYLSRRWESPLRSIGKTN